MEVLPFVTESLGDSSYLVISDGVAAVVDPQRDVRPYLTAAKERGAEIRYAVETHVHNDYVSGGPELAALGAEIVAPATSGLSFPFRPVGDGDEVQVGRAVLRAVSAPGHTHEHTAYLLLEEGRVRGAFTGGSILVASAGRTDLLGPDHTEDLTGKQWETAQKLAALLPESAEILPTHGAGSFCSAGNVGRGRTSTLKQELGSNPVLDSDSFETFRSVQLSPGPPAPSYYKHIAPINRAGPRIYGEIPAPRAFTPQQLRDAIGGGVRGVDVRPREVYAEAHVPRTLSIEEGGSMLAYVGWMLPFNAPLALVTQDGEQAARVTVDLARIGFEEVRGFLPFSEWTGAGMPVKSLPLVDKAGARQLTSTGRLVVDVRFAYEQEAAPIPGAVRIPIDQLPARADTIKAHEPLFVCASGLRSVMAASFVEERDGCDPVALNGGTLA